MLAFPSLSVNPSYPLIEEWEDNTLRSDFEGGYQITRPRFTRTRRKFSIKYHFLSDGDKTALETFLITVKGGADAFNWTHPMTNVVYTVRFEKPPQFSYVNYNIWRTEFVLMEV